MNKVSLIIGALVIASPAYAQPVPPECKDFPNGGKVFVDIPVVTGPTLCQACGAGFSVPSGFVLKFSNDHHDTCELKKLDGSNSGYCRADTTCPPGTTRTYQGDTLWVCQSGGGKKPIDCPLPKIPVVTVTTPPAVASCIARLKQAEGQLTTSAKEFVTAVSGSQPGSPAGAGGATLRAGAMLTMTVAQLSGELLPQRLRRKATCDGIDRNNATAVADCNRATSDYRTSKERNDGLKYKFKDARKLAKREIAEVRAANKTAAKTGLNAASDAVDVAVDVAEQTFDVCVAELEKIVP